MAPEQFPSWWSDESWLVVIDIGIEESKFNNLLVVSAIVGQTSKMKKLSRGWGDDLSANGVDCFDAKEHWNKRSKAYHQLSTTKRKSLLRKLVSHIHQRASFGMSVCIDVPEYESVTSERFRSQWGSAYSFAIQILIILIHIELGNRNNLHGAVNVLIEDGHANSQQIMETVKKANKKSDEDVNGYWLKLGSYGLGGKACNPILQAADLLAYCTCQTHSGRYSAIHRSLVWRSPIPFLALPWSKATLDAITKDINNFLEQQREQRRLKRKAKGEVLITNEG